MWAHWVSLGHTSQGKVDMDYSILASKLRAGGLLWDNMYTDYSCKESVQERTISVLASGWFPGIYQSVGLFYAWSGILVFTGPRRNQLVPERAP